MKTTLLLLLLFGVARGQEKGYDKSDSMATRHPYFVVTKYDTIFAGIDTTFLKLGFEEYGNIRVYDALRVDSVWQRISTGWVIRQDKLIKKTHYYLKNGNRIYCDSDVYFMTKAWLKAD